MKVSSTSNEEETVIGKTTLGKLISRDVSQQTVELLIGAPMPDPALKVKDYASINGLDFELLKTDLPAEVDKMKS